MSKVKCANCGSSKSEEYCKFTDGSYLCTKCERKIGDKWEKEIEDHEFLNKFGIKKQYLSIIFFGLILTIAVLFFKSSAISLDNISFLNNQPTYINTALFYADTENFILQFDVLNQDKKPILTEGYLSVKIVDGTGTSYYEKIHEITSENHGIRNSLSGDVVDTHVVRIDADDVKSVSRIYYGLFAEIQYITIKPKEVQFEELKLPYNDII